MGRKLSPELEEFIRTGKVVFNPDVPDLSKTPGSIQRAKEVQEWLLKVGLPDFEKYREEENNCTA